MNPIYNWCRYLVMWGTKLELKSPRASQSSCNPVTHHIVSWSCSLWSVSGFGLEVKCWVDVRNWWDVSVSQGDSPVEVGQHRPGRPLQLQEVLDCHLGEGVAGVQVHDQPHHHSDQHGDLGGVSLTLTAVLEAGPATATREGRLSHRHRHTSQEHPYQGSSGTYML